jgi:hypothetical protein
MKSLPFLATRRSLLRAGAGLAAAPVAALADEAPGILVVGDSQAQGLAGGLQRLFRRKREYRVIDRSKIATGLLPRSSYDWPVQIHSITAAEHAEIGVAMFGANDRPALSARARADEALLGAFQQSYGAHVGEVARALKAACRVVVWVGHPVVRDAAYQEDMKILNAIYEKQATDAGALFLSLADKFVDADGQYDAFGPGEDGAVTRLRADDGVHLTPSGYSVLAKLVMEKAAA